MEFASCHDEMKSYIRGFTVPVSIYIKSIILWYLGNYQSIIISHDVISSYLDHFMICIYNMTKVYFIAEYHCLI